MTQNEDLDSQPRRSESWVNQRLQSYLLIYQGAFGAFFVAAFLAVDWYFQRQLSEFTAGIAQDPSRISELLQGTTTLQSQRWMALLVFAVVFVTSWLVQGFVIGHRIAGPVFKVTQFLNEFAAGQTRKALHFREKDFFHELAEAVNRALQLKP